MSVLGNRNERKYVGLFQGRFVLKVPEGTPNAVTRTNKNGKQVTEIQFTSLEGILKDIIYDDGSSNEYGAQYKFVIADEEEEVYFTSSIKGDAASAIINRLPNLDLNKPISLNVGYNNSKEKTYFFMEQRGENVEDHFQKWDDDKKEWVRFHEFPAWEKKEVNGEEVWDATKQIKYQKGIINRYFSFEAQSKRQVGATPADQPTEEEWQAMKDRAQGTKGDEGDGRPIAEDHGEVDDLPF